MPLEGIPVGSIMMTVTGFLTVSAFIVFGMTCFNMKKKRNSKLSKTGADESLPADPTAVVVVPVVAQMSVDDVKDSSLVVTTATTSDGTATAVDAAETAVESAVAVEASAAT